MNKGGSKGQEELLLTEALSRFCDVEMPARNLSPETRRGYSYDLTEWVASASSSLPVSALSTDVIARYLSALDVRGLRGSTRHRKVAAIKTFLRYLEREGTLPVDFSGRISWPEVQRDEPRALSVPEYTALLREGGHHPRDAAILELLLQTGIRLSELTALTVEDISLPTKPSLDPVNGYGLLRVRRKGRRLQELILNYKACRALKAYLRGSPGVGRTPRGRGWATTRSTAAPRCCRPCPPTSPAACRWTGSNTARASARCGSPGAWPATSCPTSAWSASTSASPPTGRRSRRWRTCARCSRRTTSRSPTPPRARAPGSARRPPPSSSRSRSG